MKLVRFGAPGAEKPGLVDAQGAVRDLSAHVKDITGETLSPASLDKLRKIDVNRCAGAGRRAPGPARGGSGNFLAIGSTMSTCRRRIERFSGDVLHVRERFANGALRIDKTRLLGAGRANRTSFMDSSWGCARPAVRRQRACLSGRLRARSFQVEALGFRLKRESLSLNYR